MSARDQNLVAALGVSVAQVADAVGRSRQAVNRGIQKGSNYFGAADLAHALTTWRESDAQLFSVAKAKVCELYPDIKDAVLQALDEGLSTSFSVVAPGEYWFVTGDLMGFKTDLPSCAAQLESLCALPAAQVKIFIGQDDEKAALRMEAKYRANNTQTVLCKSVNLKFAPSTLLRIDPDNNLDVYGASDAGFTPLSSQEASRLRIAIQNLLPPEEPN